jgi:hypothetical protein
LKASSGRRARRNRSTGIRGSGGQAGVEGDDLTTNDAVVVASASPGIDAKVVFFVLPRFVFFFGHPFLLPISLVVNNVPSIEMPCLQVYYILMMMMNQRV